MAHFKHGSDGCTLLGSDQCRMHMSLEAIQYYLLGFYLRRRFQDVLYSIFTVCFFTVTVSHHYISNDSISCNLLHFLISEGEYGWRNRMDLRHPLIGSQVTVG